MLPVVFQENMKVGDVEWFKQAWESWYKWSFKSSVINLLKKEAKLETSLVKRHVSYQVQMVQFLSVGCWRLNWKK